LIYIISFEPDYTIACVIEQYVVLSEV
jgi:hypothetical protein